MYRLITESLLGLRREGDSLRFEPCLPPEWTEFKILYRYRETLYHIVVSQLNAQGDDNSVTLDGINQPNGVIPLLDDHIEHHVTFKIIKSLMDLNNQS
ncbi:glycosyl hydrolase family 65 protein [Thiothrix subterranea]